MKLSERMRAKSREKEERRDRVSARVWGRFTWTEPWRSAGVRLPPNMLPACLGVSGQAAVPLVPPCNMATWPRKTQHAHSHTNTLIPIPLFSCMQEGGLKTPVCLIKCLQHLPACKQLSKRAKLDLYQGTNSSEMPEHKAMCISNKMAHQPNIHHWL